MDLKRISKKRKEEHDILPDANNIFAFTAGYTSEGFPYGVTREEVEDINEESINEELPFT